MSTAVTVVFSTWILFWKRDSGIPKESQGLSRCNHHGFAPLSSFSDLNISSKKKKKRESFLVPVTPALLLVSLRNHWCHPPLPNPTSFNAVQTIRGLAQNHWHTKRKKSLNFLLQMKSGFMGETRQYISWQPKNRNPSVCVDHKINSFLWGHMWPAQGPIWWLPCSVNGLWGSDWNLTQKNSPACVYVVWKTGADKKKKKK